MGLPLVVVSENKRFLQTVDGNPFFWLGDTAWELFHALNREDAVLYMENRKEKEFTVVQAVLLAEFDGLVAPNPYGRLPLMQNPDGFFDPTMPDMTGDYHYWEHVEYILDIAETNGLYVALLPTWGDKYNQGWGRGPEIFNGQNAFAYGKWLGEQYKDRTNIIWVLGGDREYREFRHFEVLRGMADGLRSGGAQQLITAHPAGYKSSSLQLAHEKWMDLNLIQSGHGEFVCLNYELVEKDYKQTPVKPTIESEANYEDHPICFNPKNGYFDAADVRRASYWAVFSGSAGITYGHHCIWSFWRDSETYLKEIFPNDNAYFVMEWKEALNRPAAGQMKYVRLLMESLPYFSRVPAQEMIVKNFEGANHIVATKGDGYALFYTPNGLAIEVILGVLQGKILRACWFDPRNGTYTEAVEVPNTGRQCFQTPSRGRNHDWILLLSSMG